MSVLTRAPLRMAGANMTSGSPNTGEMSWTQGGAQVVSQSGMFSGNPDGGITIVGSGQAGRLNMVVIHNLPGTLWAQSGIKIDFWDGGASPALTSGGPFAASGHKLIATYNAPTGLSGQPSAAVGVQPPLGMPFTNGLFARAGSGAPGFSVSYSPEVPNAIYPNYA